MTDYSDIPGATRCLKNCFECPECSSPVEITVTDTLAGTAKGKQFLLNCTFCSYSYNTEVITKPAPLAKILRASGDPRFKLLCEKYIAERELLKNPYRLNINRLIEDKLKQMDLAPESVNTHRFHLQKFTKASELPLYAKVPLGKHLLAKRLYSCPSCLIPLLCPVADPRLMKFLEKEFAVDVFPLLLAKELKQEILDIDGDINCLLSVINPLPNSMNIKVSTTEVVPHEFTGSKLQITLSFPITSFTVTGRREKAGLLETLPTQYLTDATAASRTEKLTRSIKKAGKQNEAEVVAIETGSNWVTVPFTYSIEDISAKLGRFPLYVTVETRMPQKWMTKGGLNFGFWALVPLDRCTSN